MKILRIGDPHVRPSNIQEFGRIMETALEIAGRKGVNRIEILGDLFHTHAIVRLEVLEFWGKWFEILTEASQIDHIETVVLVGNHDMTGDRGSRAHAMSVFPSTYHSPKIIDAPTKLGIYGYLPYKHDHGSFMQGVQQLASDGAKVLICHQTIGGAQYENGFYAPDAIDPAGIPFDLIISGHIHKRQIIEAGKQTIIYPGTAKWDTLSDANEDKGLWLYEHDEQTGKIVSSEFFSTAKIVRPLISLTWKYGEELPSFPENANVTVELVGPSHWIKEQKDILRGKASIKAKITDSRMSQRSTGSNLAAFVENVFETGLDRKRLLQFMQEEGLV